MNAQTASEQNLQNDKVHVLIHRKPNCRVELETKVTKPIVQEAHRKAIKLVAKEASIPGFRKGKAPDELILKHFSKAVEEKWQKTIAEAAFKECEAIAKIPVLHNDSKIQFHMKNHSLQDGAEMVFSFETDPLIPSINFSELSLSKVPKGPVGDAELDDVLHKIRVYFCKWSQVLDRPVKEKDFIIVDVDLIEEAIPKRAFSHTRIEVTRKNMAKWMHDLVLGMHVGETKEGFSQADDDASEEDKKVFTPKKVSVHLTTIEEPILPPVDDELAQKVGADTTEIMKERLMKLLEKEAHDNQYKKYRDELSKLLLENHPFDVPMSLLQKEIEFRFTQKIKNKSYKAFFDGLSKEEKETEIDILKKESEEALRLFYICRQIIQDNKIQLSEDELRQGAKTPLDAMFMDPELLHAPQNEEERAVLMSKYMLKKAEDFAIEKILHHS